ncbi:MAG: hypothetical protein ACP5OR_04750 [Candidatus Dormibacteria bacterium]
MFPGGFTNDSVPGLTVAVTTMPYVAYSAIFWNTAPLRYPTALQYPVLLHETP